MDELIMRLDYQAVLIIEFVLWVFFLGGLSFVGVVVWRLFSDWIKGGK